MTNKIKFEFVILKYQKMVFRMAMGFVHSKEDAEDLTQDVFLAAYLSWDTFRGDAEISTWLHKIVVNVSLNYIKKQQSQDTVQLINDTDDDIFDCPSEEKNPYQLLENFELKETIQKAIDTLPDRQRTAFVLSECDDLHQQEIAAKMGIHEGAVEQLLQRAKKNLQKKLRKSVGK